MRRRLTFLLIVLPALAAMACLGSLRHDLVAESIALAPREALGLPVHESRPYWLLRAADGWYSAHEIRFGGDPPDPAVATVRAVRFRSADAAGAGFARLAPAYLYAAFRDSMTGEPRPFEYPGSLAGDQVSTTLYGVRLPPDAPANLAIDGQLTAIRASAVVLLIDSIGVPPAQLIPAMQALVAAANREGGPP